MIEKVPREDSAVLVGQNGDLELLQTGNAPLRRRVELAKRFNFVVEKLNANGTGKVRREHVQDSAAIGELARQRNRAG